MDAERARRNESALLQAIARMGLEPLAREIGVSEATVSRLKNEHLPHFAKLMAACGYKTVPIDMECYRPESIAAVLTLAKERMQQIESPRQLIWEE